MLRRSLLSHGAVHRVTALKEQDNRFWWDIREKHSTINDRATNPLEKCSLFFHLCKLWLEFPEF